MENKLENIFVSYEIAKLAYEKGFREWCAGIGVCDNSVGTMLNTEKDDIDFEYLGNPSKGYYGLPTHFQLMAWLLDNHNIDMFILHRTLSNRGSLDVEKFNINIALEIALNTLPDVS